MAHNTTSADAMRALDRYRRVTGDSRAQLLRTGAKGEFYRIEADGLRGEFYGAAMAAVALNSYSDGYRDGMEEGLAFREYEAQPIDMARAAGHNV